MLAYWTLFFLVAAFAVAEPRRTEGYNYSGKRLPVVWVIVPAVITFLVGFRVEVGGDWYAYLDYLERIHGLSLQEVLSLGDPGYQLLNYIASAVGGGIYTVNLLCGFFFSLGLMVFCKNLPRPMLAIVTAIPYMTIVLAMGYSRQATALGFGMIALNALIHKSTFRFSIWIIVAALFHKSAVLLIPVAALISSKSRMLSVLWITIAAVGAYIILLQDSVDALYANYVEAEYQSQGALIRVFMCVVPSVIFLYYRNLFNMLVKEKQIWGWFSYASLISFAILFLTSASTAVDRVALYLLPLQLVVFAHLPEVLGNPNKANKQWVLLICSYYCLVLFVWLFFAGHNFAWLPYQFYPFTLL